MSVNFRNTLQWPVHVLGYEWRKGSSLGPDAVHAESRKDELLLVPRGAETRTYSPTEHRDLFRKFASLDGSADSILDFANDHGRLVEEGADGENILAWQEEIHLMDRLLTAWDFLKGGTTLTKAQVVRRVLGDETDSWNKTRRTSTQLRGRLAQVIESNLNPPVFSYRARRPTIFRSPASEALLLAQFLEWDDTRRLFDRQVQQATSLLVLMWSQTLEALTGVRDFRRCAYARCSVMIEVSRDTAGGRTARAKFHSDSCRALASRLGRSESKRNRQPKG